MNVDTNKFEALRGLPGWEDMLHPSVEIPTFEAEPNPLGNLCRPDGSPVPKHWPIFQVGESVVIKNYTFKVAYIGETAILFEPVGLPILSDNG